MSTLIWCQSEWFPGIPGVNLAPRRRPTVATRRGVKWLTAGPVAKIRTTSIPISNPLGPRSNLPIKRMENNGLCLDLHLVGRLRPTGGGAVVPLVSRFDTGGSQLSTLLASFSLIVTPAYTPHCPSSDLITFQLTALGSGLKIQWESQNVESLCCKTLSQVRILKVWVWWRSVRGGGQGYFQYCRLCQASKKIVVKVCWRCDGEVWEGRLGTWSSTGGCHCLFFFFNEVLVHKRHNIL